MSQQPIFAITGQLAAGKSTLARALVGRYELGLHIDVDELRGFVTTGRADPLHWTDETTRQFGLAIEAAVAIAAIYHRAGFAVAIEGALDPRLLDRHLDGVGLRDRVVAVELHPPIDVAFERNRTRTTKPFDPAILEPAIRTIDADISADPAPHGWTRIDNGEESLTDTVARILAIAGERR